MRCVAVAVGFMLLIAADARAQSGTLPLELSWQAPAECAAAHEVRAELQRIAGATDGEALTKLVATVEIKRDGERYAAQLHTEHAGNTGERSLQADDCKTLVRSVTLVLALAFGRGIEDAQGPTTSSPTAPTAPAAAESTTSKPAATASTTSTDAARADASSTAAPMQADERDDDAAENNDASESDSDREQRSVGFMVGAGAELLLFPAIAPLLTVGLSIPWQVISLELHASGLPGTLTTIDGGTSALFEGAYGTALLCVYEICLGPRVGVLHSEARGVTRSDSAVAPYSALVLRAAPAWPRRSVVQVAIVGGLALSLNRPQFVVRGSGDTYDVPLLAGELSVELRIHP